MFTELFPILAATDMPRALGFYRDLLGGVVSYEFTGPDGEIAYVALQIGASQVGIGSSPTEAADGVRGVSLWVYADDCDAAIERLRAAGVVVTEEPTDQPWGERVARVRDPDGNEVIIGRKAPQID